MPGSKLFGVASTLGCQPLMMMLQAGTFWELSRKVGSEPLGKGLKARDEEAVSPWDVFFSFGWGGGIG